MIGRITCSTAVLQRLPPFVTSWVRDKHRSWSREKSVKRGHEGRLVEYIELSMKKGVTNISTARYIAVSTKTAGRRLWMRRREVNNVCEKTVGWCIEEGLGPTKYQTAFYRFDLSHACFQYAPSRTEPHLVAIYPSFPALPILPSNSTSSTISIAVILIPRASSQTSKDHHIPPQKSYMDLPGPPVKPPNISKFHHKMSTPSHPVLPRTRPCAPSNRQSFKAYLRCCKCQTRTTTRYAKWPTLVIRCPYCRHACVAMENYDRTRVEKECMACKLNLREKHWRCWACDSANYSEHMCRRCKKSRGSEDVVVWKDIIFSGLRLVHR